MSLDHLTQLWIQIIKHLALYHDSKKISGFLNKCSIESINEETNMIIVATPNDFVLSQVKKFFYTDLVNAIKECYNPHYQLTLIVDASIPGVEIASLFDIPKERQTQVAKKINDIERVYEKHKDQLSDYFGVLFDTKYQFSNFIVGPNNEFAYSILQAIVAQPGIAHNPFFLHGNVGLGKTHLLQATGNQIMNHFPEKTVVYLPTSKLVTDIIEGLKNNTVNKLLRKFDDVDVLILDDIQVIANKNACQDILLGLFNQFVDKHKQVIFSGDKPPRHLLHIEDRLKTRFALGTLCEITQADFETRVAILRAKRGARGVTLIDEGYTLIADTITDNIRELEGITNTLITKQAFTHQPLTIEDIHYVLRSMGYESRGVIASATKTPVRKKSKDNEFAHIVEMIAGYYGLSVDDMIGDSRKQELVLARSIAMWVAKYHFGRTFEKIGSYFHKNHSSIMYTIDKINDTLKTNQTLKEDMMAMGIKI